jgi:signal peptidase I
MSEPDSEKLDSIFDKFGISKGDPVSSSSDAAGEPGEESTGPARLWQEVEEFGKEFLPTFAFFLAIRLAIVEPRYIPSLSMFPTFNINDQLAVEKVSKWFNPSPARRDVVVFNPPQRFYDVTGSFGGEALIKRVVAVAGDVVEMRDNTLYVNDEAQTEPYIAERATYTLAPLKVPAGSVFVLGDNRNASNDGHIWGFLPVQNIIGRAAFNYWPPNKIGTVAKFSGLE